MTHIEFFCPMVPPDTTHNDLEVRFRSKGGKRVPFIAKSANLLDAENRWRVHLAPFAPTHPIEGAAIADVRICWPVAHGHAQGEPKTTKPDLDNVEKVLWDVLVGLGYIADDALIVSKSVSKMYSDPAGIYIKIEGIEGMALTMEDSDQ